MPSTVLSLCTLYAKSNRKRRQGNDKDSGCSGSAMETCWYGRIEGSTNDQRRPSSIIEYTLMQYKHTHAHTFIWSHSMDTMALTFGLLGSYAHALPPISIFAPNECFIFFACVWLYTPPIPPSSPISLFISLSCAFSVLALYLTYFEKCFPLKTILFITRNVGLGTFFFFSHSTCSPFTLHACGSCFVCVRLS